LGSILTLGLIPMSFKSRLINENAMKRTIRMVTDILTDSGETPAGQGLRTGTLVYFC
jgi:hypothetical protein